MPQRHFLPLALAVIAFPMASIAAPPQKPIDNGGFEKGWTGWMLRHGEGPEYELATPPDAFEGQRCARITIGPDAREPLRKAAYVARRDLPLAPGHYRFSFAARTQLKRGAAGAYISWQAADGTHTKLADPGANGIPEIRGTTEWQNYAFAYRVPEGGKRLAVQMQIRNGEGTVWFDSAKVEPLSEKEGRAMMQEQNPVATPMRDAGAVKLGEPCRIVNARIGKFFRHPDTGADLLTINSCCNGGGAGILVDYVAGRSRVATFPVGVGGWDVVQTGPDTLYFESLGELSLVPVSIRSGKIIEDKIFRVPYPNDYAWRLAVGPEGWIYYGSYPTCHAYRYHPETGKSEDLGRLGGDDKTDGNMYVRHLAVNKDGWLVAFVGLKEKKTVALNTKTGEQITLEPPVPSWVTGIGNEIYGRLFLGKDEEGNYLRKLVIFNSGKKVFEEVDFPKPEALEWRDMAYGSQPDRLVLMASDSSWWVLEPDKPPRKIWDLPLRGGTIVGIDAEQRIIGYRGQDYFVAEPMAQTLKDLRPIAKNPPAVGMHFLRADPEGGITGGPNFGQTLFRFDPARNLAQNTPQVVDHGGEVYDGRWIDGKFYFMSYGGGDLGMWDPSRPWDQWNGVNPKVVAKYNTEKWGTLIRPQGGLIVGPNGRLYSGLSAGYGIYDGGIAEYDIATDTLRSWRASELFGPQTSIGRIAGDDRYLYGVTSNNFNGVKDLSKDLVFFVFDPETEKVLFKHPIEGQSRYAVVVVVPETGHVWLADIHGAHRFDPAAMAFATHLTWPKEADAPGTVNCYDTRGDRAWFASGKTVTRLNDGAKPTLATLFAMDSGSHGLAAGADGKLYFAQDTEIWAVLLSP